MRCSRCDAVWPDGAGRCPDCGAFADEPPPLLDLDESPAEPGGWAPVRDDPQPRALDAPRPRELFDAPSRNVAPAAPAAQLPSDIERYRELLRERFGYPDFRPGQAEVLQRLASDDVLGVMPTGGGKSLCYVLPGLEVGRALVVSPLIALMQDQVEALQAAGVAADYINSTLSAREQQRRLADFTEGRTALLYVAPERLANPRFIAVLQRHGVRLLVVDEAHCISEWGHDFRPDYLELGAVRAQLGEPRTLALTATADATVRRDILARLGIAGASEVVTSFDRPNLRLAARQIDSPAERLDWLVRYVRERHGQRGKEPSGVPSRPKEPSGASSRPKEPSGVSSRPKEPSRASSTRARAATSTRPPKRSRRRASTRRRTTPACRPGGDPPRSGASRPARRR